MIYSRGTDNGNRTYYLHTFRTSAFYEDNLIDFKGLCKPTTASYMFYNMNGTHVPLGIDFSNINVDDAEAITALFAYSSSILEIPDLNIPILKKLSAVYGWCQKLHTIHGKIRVDENTSFSSTLFREDYALENMEIEGKIGQNNFNVKDCKKLTKASLLSILKALSLDITTTTTITFSTEHQSIIETDTDCKPYWEAAKNAGWSFVYA